MECTSRYSFNYSNLPKCLSNAPHNKQTKKIIVKGELGMFFHVTGNLSQLFKKTDNDQIKKESS
jgi:hypothetical protein